MIDLYTWKWPLIIANIVVWLVALAMLVGFVWYYIVHPYWAC